MTGWRKPLLIAVGFGGGFAIVMAAIMGGWLWYQGRPKPWNTRAIIATFDDVEIESSESEGPHGADTIVVYYTLENTTEIDYRMPLEQLHVNGLLKQEKSLTGTRDITMLDKGQVFIAPKQRTRFAVRLNYPVKESFGPEPKTSEEWQRRSKLVADYIKREFPNLGGFVVFDNINRYQINLPNGWDNT